MDQVRSGELRLSAQLPFEFEPFAPPGDIVDLVNSFYVIRTDSGALEEIVPAYSAQLLMFVSGSARLRPGGPREYPTSTVCFSTPLLEATPVTFEGPCWILGASLTALGWQALSGLPADEINGRLIEGAEVLEPEAMGELERCVLRCRGGEADPAQVFALIGNILRTRRSLFDTSHVRMVGRIMEWLASDLTPPIADLYRDIGASRRTVQRVSRRYFGVSPSRLVKRFRAIRTAMLLANPALPQEMREAVIDAYFDQAHLIRDIRRYAGRTPARLPESTMFEDTLDPDAHGEAARLLRPRSEGPGE